MEFTLDKQKMYVVSDFDYTLTSDLGKTTWGIIAFSKRVDENYREKVNELYTYYTNIDRDMSLSDEERSIYMSEWWNKHLNYLIDYQVTKECLCNLAQDNHIILREGAREFLEFLYQNKIPLFIVSAGITDVIEAFLRGQNLFFDNITICSNRFVFNNGVVAGIEGGVIHMLNKGEVVWTDKMCNQIKERRQILLLGDMAHDVHAVSFKQRSNTYRVLMKTKDFDNRLKDLYDTATDNYFEILKLLA
jgi:HAD superfamily hydrolase (TIGR01544 family)